MTSRSIHEPCRYAAITPSGTAISTVMIMVTVASASVGPTRCPISSVTSALKKNDRRSPRSRLPIQITNCSRIGRLSPSLSRISAIWPAVALSPAMIAAGSPGVSRSIRNTKIATIASTGTVASRRRATKASMSGGPLPRNSSLLLTFQKNRAGPWTTPETVLRYAIG